MNLLETNQRYLAILKDIVEISQLCATRTYIWAGLVRDILAGEFLRQHSDVDCFTLNLWDVQNKMIELFTQRGYAISSIPEVDFLKIERNGVHAVLNHLEFDDSIATWRHAGKEGTVYFPREWLADTPQKFYDTNVFVSGIEFEYAIKTHPELLNPEWKIRPKDFDAVQWLRRTLAEKQITPETVLKRVWSYNPFWVRKGYLEYAMPTVAWTLEPRTVN